MSRSALRLVDEDGNILLYITPDEVIQLVDYFDDGTEYNIVHELIEVLEDELGS